MHFNFQRPRPPYWQLGTGNWELFPFRYGRGPSPDYPENQTACHPNVPAPKRPPSGTICGENFSSGTAGPAKLLTCPILTF